MGKADDGGRIGYRQPPPAFSRRYDLCSGTALRFPMSVRNAASREITSPMPTFDAYPTLHRHNAADGLPGLLRARNVAVN
jgi:hypothetical protein